MKKIGTALMWSAVLAAGGWLAGCASDTPDTASAESNQQTPIPSPENFTTLGKPTKTIQTPNGTVEIYDPTQDPEVRGELSQIYYAQNTNPTVIPELDFTRHVQEAQRLQLMRAGCSIVQNSYCEFCVMKQITRRKPSNLKQVYVYDASVCHPQDYGVNGKQAIHLIGEKVIGCRIGDANSPQMYGGYNLQTKRPTDFTRLLSYENYSKALFKQNCQKWNSK